MSAEHPIIAITGSSGNDTAAFTKALEHIFYRERVKAVYLPGSGFHRYDRQSMEAEVAKARQEGQVLSHYSPAANCLDKLEELYQRYAKDGTGEYRYYLHTTETAAAWGLAEGTLTPWQRLDPDSDLLLYRGMHGAAVTGDINLAQYPDLIIGVSPNLNLEWMQRIRRDQRRGRSLEVIRETLLERMHDYVRYIAPQFSHTHVNFQMVPMIDTSDPFDPQEYLPHDDECVLIIHFQKLADVDFVELVKRIKGAKMARRDTLVVPGSQMLTAVEIVLMPYICDLVRRSRAMKGIKKVPRERGAGILGMLNQLYR